MAQATGQNRLFKEKVHVAFLGWEIERIVKPVMQMRGDRLILICFPRSQEAAWPYLEEIKRQAEESKIKVEVIETSLYKLVDLLAVLNKVFQVERLRGNDLFINVSAGTKISACASTIAAMSTKEVTAYYVRTDTYYPKLHEFKPPVTLTTGVKEVVALPDCQIDLPDAKYIKTLGIIEKMKRDRKDRGTFVYVKDLIERLKTEGLITVKRNRETRKQTSSEYMAANALFKPLLSWDYITMSPKRRNKYVDITEKGTNAVRMYMDYELGGTHLAEHGNDPITAWIEWLGKADGDG